MNYTFRLDNGSRTASGLGTKIGVQFLEEWRRPQVGQEIILNDISTRIWKVLRVEPPSNPTGQSNTYFLAEVK